MDNGLRDADDRYTVGAIDRKIDIRIEALCAASRVVAGGISGGVKPMQYGVEASVEEYTLALAGQFARWLEKGE